VVKPIHEPVVSHDSLVMNTQEEIPKAVADVRVACFGKFEQAVLSAVAPGSR
jgi:redox-sensitive bicupin YhaK (pirin superfamily)